MAQIARERREGTQRLERDRDVSAWKSSMDRLDREEIQAARFSAPGPTAAEVATALRDVQSLFVDAEATTQHRIVHGLLEKVEVPGPSQIWLHPSLEPEARGWATAMTGEFRVEICQSGRGERTRADTFQLTLRIRREQSAPRRQGRSA